MEDNILRLEIPVDNLVLMHVIKGLERLLEDVLG